MTRIKDAIQALDSRSKILGVLMTLMILALSRNGTLLLHLINMIPSALLAGLVLRQPWKIVFRFRYLFVFLLLAAVFHLGLFLYVPSLRQTSTRAFIYLLSTSFCGICFGAFLSVTTSAADFAQGLMQLKFPLRATWMMTLAYRFLPLIHAEVHNSFSAASLRGFRWHSRQGRDFARLTAGLTQRIYEQAIQTGNAMYLRGFNMTTRPSGSRSLTTRDYLFLFGLPITYLLIRWVIS